jgi:hypothetical protein
LTFTGANESPSGCEPLKIHKGVKKVIMIALPVFSMLQALLSRCVGKQLRWTKDRSVQSLGPKKAFL